MAIGSDAHKLYAQYLRKGQVDAIPRSKFLFTVSLNIVGRPQPLVLERIANISMPSFNFKTTTLNQYNSKRVAQMGVDYTPITLTAYDTKDAELEQLLKDYTAHYIAGPMNTESRTNWLDSVKGIKLTQDRNFIQSITITRFDTANKTNTIEIFNPYISNIDADTFDYGDSAPAIYRLGIVYEGYRIESDGQVPTDLGESATSDAGFIDSSNPVNDIIERQGTTLTDATTPEQNPVIQTIGKVVSNQPQLKPFTGSLKSGETLRNINGKSYVVPAPTGN